MTTGQSYFDVRWLDEPIEYFHIPGELPLQQSAWYERREAARFALYKWEEFLALSDGAQAGVVAHYRTHNRIEALVADYVSKKPNKKV